jgi:predicted GNAT family acetyltransferase
MMEPTIEHLAERSRYTISVDDTVVGKAYYTDEAGTRTFTHTEVDEAYGGQGLATKLVAFAVADTREAGIPVAATCPLVSAYLAKHPD